MPSIEERVQRSRLRGRAQSDGELVSIRNLAPGTWYFAVVAYNTQAIESTFSNLVSKTI